jgi:hypothetical protein
MVELIARPEKFDGRRVRTIGYAHFEFEESALYLHEEDYAHAIFLNGVWLDLGEGVSRAECQNRYVVVEGTFRSGNRGHLGAWSGAIQDVTRCGPWRSRSL